MVHCGECNLFPCEKVEHFKTGLMHHQEAYRSLEEFMTLTQDEWIEKQQKRWSCQTCGKFYSYYELKCHECGSALEGLFPDERKES